ncbi:MAG: LamG-like jellyroll fold domain-containing protein [Bacteroidota bacterium]
MLSLEAQKNTAAPTISSTTDPLPQWAQMMYAPDADLEVVSEAFQQYYQTHPFIKNQHTQYFKRLLRYRESYDYQINGSHLSAEERLAARQAERSYLMNRAAQTNTGRSGNWTCIGPFDWDHDAGGRSYAPGAAHVYTVEQCSGDANIMYAGTATAGLWRSTNRGASWTNITKDLTANQVYAVEVHPSNCNEVLAAMMSGIYRSTNGGSSWSETGSSSFRNTNHAVDDMKYHPGSTTTVWAATNNGLYRSTNNGVDWTEVMAGQFQEIEFHPTNNAIMYVIRQTGEVTEFWKSTDSGATWNQQTNGWPAPANGDHNRRAEIAVTPDNPDKVVALLTGSVNGGSGLFGIYVSTDAGVNWTFQCCGPQPGGQPSTSNINMMAWSDAGTDNGGQFYYDLALAVSPTDEDRIFVGGVNMWVSSDGGATFTCPAKWSHPDKPNYVHADLHDINYYSNGDLWVANDGGIFYSTDDGASFSRSIDGIAGSDFWGFGVGFNNDQLMLGGAYHNGTLIKNDNVYTNGWACMDGGDGVGGAVNPIYEDQAYSDRNIKTMPNNRTVSPATRGYALEPSWTYILGRFSQIEWGHDNYSIHYFGNGSGLYKTEDDNRTVTLLYDFGETVSDVEVAWTNPQVIYVATHRSGAKRVYRSSNGGLSFTTITPSQTSGSGISYDIEVSYEDEDVIWVARLGGNTPDGNKVYRSNNGGQSWTNITSTALNGEAITNIIVQRAANNQLYVGTTRSVYTSPNGGSNWSLFASGLPASIRSRQLAISYRNNKLYNATNRSVWVSDLAVTSTAKPQIAVDKYYSGCARDVFKFADHSTVGKSGPFQWSFPGATYVSSTTARNPEVIYGIPGQYDVSLTVGGQTQTLTNFVEVGNECSPQPEAGNAMSCTASNHHFRSSQALDVTTNTLTLMAWVKPDGIQDAYTGLIFNDNSGAGLNVRNNNEIGYHWSGGSTHWAWSSGVNVPEDEWSFVAMVVRPTSITFYVNEMEVTRNTTLNPVYWGTFRVGRYQGRSDRNFRGEIDEALIWNRSLNRDEIRLWRHLTKEQQADPSSPLFDNDLLAYLQFNEASGTVYDRAGINHGLLNGSATRIASTAPVGGGSSSKQMVNGGGNYTFTDEKLLLEFPATGTYPGDEIVVTQLLQSPMTAPTDLIHPGYYWIVNNYGNTTFTALERIEFWGINGLSSTELSDPEQFKLYKRASNADTQSWGDHLDQADQGNSGGRLTFSTDNGVTSFSQFAIGQDPSLILPVSFLDLWLRPADEEQVDIFWRTATEVDGDYFAVEHSSNGRSFNVIGTVPIANNATGGNYRLRHDRAVLGRNYYRIRAVDLDGEEDIFPIRSIDLSGEQPWATVYPNPISTMGTVHLRSNSPEETIFELFDVRGRRLRETRFRETADLRLFGLPNGIYTYRMTSGERTQTGQLIKGE